MAQDKTFGDAVELEWQRTKRAGLQVSKDLLAAVFSRKPLKEKQTAITITGKLSSSKRTLDLTADANIRNTTPAGVQLPFSRRVSNAQYEHIKIDVNRLSAKYLGITVDELASLSVTAWIAEKNRKNTEMMLKALVASYTENPLVVTAQSAAAVKAFPNAQNYLPLVTGASSTFYAKLGIKSFFDLCAIHDDAIGLNAYGQGKMDGSLDSITRIAIFSNKGWAAFNATNADTLGNRDFFGKSIYIDGYGEYMQIHNTLIVVLNTDFIPAATAAAVTASYPAVTFLPASATTSYLTPAIASASGNYKVTSCHHMMFVYPDAMDVRTPVQFEIAPIHYQQQTDALERAIYAGTGLECMRVFDAGVSRVFFTDDFTALTAV